MHLQFSILLLFYSYQICFSILCRSAQFSCTLQQTIVKFNTTFNNIDQRIFLLFVNFLLRIYIFLKHLFCMQWLVLYFRIFERVFEFYSLKFNKFIVILVNILLNFFFLLIFFKQIYLQLRLKNKMHLSTCLNLNRSCKAEFFKSVTTSFHIKCLKLITVFNSLYIKNNFIG